MATTVKKKDRVLPVSRKKIGEALKIAAGNGADIRRCLEDPFYMACEAKMITVEDDGSLKAAVDAIREGGAKNFLFLDFETNGINGFAVSIGAVVTDNQGNILEEFYQEINPDAPVDQEAAKVHGLTENVLKSKPKFSDIFRHVERLLQMADNVVAYNAIYDIGILKSEFERLKKASPRIFFIDAMSRLKNIVSAKNEKGRLKDAKLEEAAQFFGFDTKNLSLHNSLEDVKILKKVFFEATKT